MNPTFYQDITDAIWAALVAACTPHLKNVRTQMVRESRDFNTTLFVPWVRGAIAWGPERTAEIPADRMRINGTMFIDVNWPAVEDIQKAEPLISAIRQALSSSATISSNGQGVTGLATSRAMARTADQWTKIPLMFRFYAYDR